MACELTVSSPQIFADDLWTLQGSQEPWHNWDILSGRFVSEFGMFVSLSFLRANRI